MRTAKRVVAALLLFIAMLLLALTSTYLLVDNATLVALLTKHLAQASNTHITYRQDAAITRSLAPTLNINELLIQDNSKNFQVSISSLQLQFSLPGLLFGKLDISQLDLGDTRVGIKADGVSGKLNVPRSLPLRPILHDVRISRISIDSPDSKYSLPPIHVNELTQIPDPAGDKIVCTVQTELGGQEILLNLGLPGINEIMKSRMVPFSIAAKGEAADLSVNGQVDFNLPLPAVERNPTAAYNAGPSTGP